MQKVLAAHQFGPHHVELVELHDDECVAGYRVVVDGRFVTEPLADPPTFEDVVRIYAADERAARATRLRGAGA